MEFLKNIRSHIIKHLIASLSLTTLLILCSCTVMTPPTSKKPLALSWTERKQQLEQLHSWDIQGAIAIHSSTDSGSATIHWQQTQQNYALALLGPLGSNAVQIYGKPGLVTLQTAQGKQSSASNPEQLLYSQVGWKLPVSSLHYWIRGLPVPGEPAQSRFDSYHRLNTLSQQQWEIHFNQYSVFHGLELPTRIVLVHPQLNIKIVIYRWGNV